MSIGAVGQTLMKVFVSIQWNWSFIFVYICGQGARELGTLGEQSFNYSCHSTVKTLSISHFSFSMLKLNMCVKCLYAISNHMAFVFET